MYSFVHTLFLPVFVVPSTDILDPIAQAMVLPTANLGPSRLRTSYLVTESPTPMMYYPAIKRTMTFKRILIRRAYTHTLKPIACPTCVDYSILSTQPHSLGLARINVGHKLDLFAMKYTS